MRARAQVTCTFPFRGKKQSFVVCWCVLEASQMTFENLRALHLFIFETSSFYLFKWGVTTGELCQLENRCIQNHLCSYLSLSIIWAGYKTDSLFAWKTYICIFMNAFAQKLHYWVKWLDIITTNFLIWKKW